MGSFPTYGMAGVGIAAAIGFVFVLSFLGNNNGVVEDGGGGILESQQAADQQRASEPTADQDESGDAEMFTKDAGEQSGASPAGESTMMLADVRPTLTSVVSLDAKREMIGEVNPGTEFEAGRQVVIHASFANPNEVPISDHFIAMSVRHAAAGDGPLPQEGEHAASVQTDIAAKSTVELELYWTPETTGDYTLLLFSMTPSDLTSTEPVKPVAIPIKVVQ